MATQPLQLAVVVGLTTDVAHLANGGAQLDNATLARILEMARALTGRSEPLAVRVDPELLDALDLISDSTSIAILAEALRGRELIATPWTPLDVNALVSSNRGDLVVDGLARSAGTLERLGLNPSTLMAIEEPPGSAAGTILSSARYPVSDYLPAAGTIPEVFSLHPSAGDPGAQVQQAITDLIQNAAGEVATATVVVINAAGDVSDTSQAPLLVALLEALNTQPSIELVPASKALRLLDVGPATRMTSSSGTSQQVFAEYLERLAEVETRLHGYESLTRITPPEAATTTARGQSPQLTSDATSTTATSAVGTAPVGQTPQGTADVQADPLRTLLAASASSKLTDSARLELLEAVDRQLSRSSTGVSFVPRGKITVTSRTADLSIRLFNDRAETVTVALRFTGTGVKVAGGTTRTVQLSPGRNDLTVPVTLERSGTVDVAVHVSTPDEAGAITLATGVVEMRGFDLSGLGLVVSTGGIAAVIVWWLLTMASHRRSLQD